MVNENFNSPDSDYIDFVLNEFDLAISKKSDFVYIGYEHRNDDEVDLILKYSEWIKFLDVILEHSIEIEYFEVCNRIKKLMYDVSFLNLTKS